jgi:LCP family protein required for cell wall assembly
MVEPLPRPEPLRPPRRPRPPRRGRGRRVALGILLGVLAAVIALGVAGFLWARWQYGKIDRVEMDGVLASDASGGTNWLIVGSDSRADIDPNRPDAGVLLAEPVEGERSDAMIVLHLEDGQASMLSLPRDLWVPQASGGEGRLNAAYATGGPQNLVATIQSSLGIPIHHYMEIDITGFGDVVDAVGGLQMDFPYPAYDKGSGLRIDQAGPVELDGLQALAFVRSRHYTELVDGGERPDPTGDIGRTVRQQQFLSALLDEVGSVRNPVTLNRVVGAVADDVTLDDQTGLGDLISVARKLGGLDAELLALPVRNTTANGSSVLVLADGAEQVLDQVR